MARLQSASANPPPYPQPREAEGELHNEYVRALGEIVDGAIFFLEACRENPTFQSFTATENPVLRFRGSASPPPPR